jgi:hypothetical protein
MGGAKRYPSIAFYNFIEMMGFAGSTHPTGSDMADTFPASEEVRRFKQRRRSFATAELSDQQVQAISASRMDERHAHLDSILQPK